MKYACFCKENVDDQDDNGSDCKEKSDLDDKVGYVRSSVVNVGPN